MRLGEFWSVGRVPDSLREFRSVCESYGSFGGTRASERVLGAFGRVWERLGEFRSVWKGIWAFERVLDV